jgi:DNA-binding beta-propeller fold protein YncE
MSDIRSAGLWAGARQGVFGRFALVPSAVTLVCCLAGLLLLAATASAKPLKFESSFNGEATPAKSMEPTFLAVNEQTGDVYVIDAGNDAIDVFNKNGEYQSQILGSSTEAGTFSLGSERDDIAIDNSAGPDKGRIYVESEAVGLVFAFSPAGEFLWQAHPGENGAAGIAVDPAGNIWASETFGGIQQLDPQTGATAGPVLFNGKEPGHIAFDALSNLAALFSFAGHVYNLKEEELHTDETSHESQDIATDTVQGSVWTNAVFEVDRGGVWIWEASGAQVAETPFAVTGKPRSVAVNAASGKVYVTVPSLGEVDVLSLLPQLNLSVVTMGSGQGVVACDGAPCKARYDNTEAVKLEPTANEGSVFAGWKVNGSSLTCPGIGDCEITLSADTTVEADFALAESELTVSETGTGEVTSAPAGIACGATCKAKFPTGEFIVLAAKAAAHNHLVGWKGCDTVTAGSCEVALESDRSVSAEFAPTIRKLAVTPAGTGSGTVTCQVGAGSPGPCSPEYQDGTEVTITATATAGSTFAGFSGGGCSASPCTATLSGDTAVTATFNLAPVEKPVEKPVELVKPPTEIIVPPPPPPPHETTKPPVKKPTRAQLLTKALKKCKKLPKHKRPACVKQAEKKYGPKHTAKKK